MNLSQTVWILAVFLWTATAWGQSDRKEPHVGYLYPAGGQQGSVVRIIAGGQMLQGAARVHISGEGVRASVIQYFKPLKNLDKEERLELQRRLIEVRDKRLAELPSAVRSEIPPQSMTWLMGAPRAQRAVQGRVPGKMDAEKSKQVQLPEHPLFYDLENKSLRELAHLVSILTIPRGMIPVNRQIAETVLVDVTLDPSAATGNRELRFETPRGLTNPIIFQVGSLPEIRELEPNDPIIYPNRPNAARLAKLLPEPPLTLPVLLNGQITPGDMDHFRFQAKQGQQLVIEVQARSLIPYLADAVPGWFQAVLTLSDAKGRELAFAGNDRFNPDPVLFFKVPEDGEYDLEIRDALYRGREDFVYRIAVGELPFITGINPLGGRMGGEAIASLTGWNLTVNQMPLNTQPGVAGIRQTISGKGSGFFNPVPYAVDTLPECHETEPNDGNPEVQSLVLPQIVNGCINHPGDVDVFQFKGSAGEEVVAEVIARRLHSPLDSLLRLTDSSGKVLGWNDDHEDKETGLITHSADSYLRVRLPEDGLYRVQLTDSQHHGGEDFCYRLRLSAPRPDFVMRMTPSSLNLIPGSSVPIRVYALRKDGFEGDIDVNLRGAPMGFAVSGGRISGGRDSVRMTVTAPLAPIDHPIVLNLEGGARINGQWVVRPVIPAEDMMQAFIYRHLVPSQELLALVSGPRRRATFIELANKRPVAIPAGGEVSVRLKAPNLPILRELQLALDDPPPGVTLHEVNVVPGGMTFLLEADGNKAKEGFLDNLIVEIFLEREGRKTDKGGQKQKQRVSLGVLPAIPIVVVPYNR